MKKIISLSVVICVLLAALLAVGISASAESGGEEERLGVGEGAAALDGKKVLFTGCSYTYYGGIVEQTGAGVYSQATRTSGETGFFKRLCQANGADVTVTDWVFGGHDLTDIFDGYCNAGAHDGHDHLADLTDRDYDYVVLQEILVPGFDEAEDYYENVKDIIELFRNANPDVKIYFMLHQQVYSQATYGNEWKKSIQMIAEEGVTVIDWGSLVVDIYTGAATVPNSEFTYNRQSFVVSNSAADGYHPNLLAGYLGTIMTYAIMTGETTIGQPYKFIYPLTSKYLNIDKFIQNHYKYDDPGTEYNEKTTNMEEIFYSESEMLGLQTLANEYLEKTRWLDYAEYSIDFVDDDGELIESVPCKWGEMPTAPTPTKETDNVYSYSFAGWDKEVVPCCGDATYTATYDKEYVDYTVQFLDADGSLLSEQICHWGDTPAPPVPDGYEDEDYRYVFNGWDTGVVACCGDAIYTATYRQMAIGFAVVFRDWDGSAISANTYKAGEVIAVPDAPSREASNVYFYTFVGWDTEPAEICTGDATYTAVYSRDFVDYTVTFVGGNGEVISEAVYHWGDEITAPADAPKASDEVYEYEFAGWDPFFSATCEGDATYVACYEEKHIIYSVVFYNDEGEVIVTRNYRYGQVVTPPMPPIKLSDDTYDYIFVSWDKEVTDCFGNASYTAVYEAVAKEIEPEPPTEPDDTDIVDPPSEEPTGFFDRVKAWFEGVFGSITAALNKFVEMISGIFSFK